MQDDRRSNRLSLCKVLEASMSPNLMKEISSHSDQCSIHFIFELWVYQTVIRAYMIPNRSIKNCQIFSAYSKKRRKVQGTSLAKSFKAFIQMFISW